jgi:SPP1 family predicted phage head-tail adaptor
LDRRITFLKDVGTDTNSLNEKAEDWQSFATVWASVKGLGSRELYQAQKVFSETSLVIKIRYRRDITEEMRISYDGGTYEILGKPIDPEGRRETLVISAKEVI